MKRVEAEQVITWECNCPNCGEKLYSEFEKDWDTNEMIHYDQEIECTDCNEIFKVGI